MAVNNNTSFLDIPITLEPLESLAKESICAVNGDAKQVVFACANPHSLLVARSDAVFRSALLNANQVVADGVGVTIMAKVLGIPMGSRITGSDYFFAVMKALAETGRGRVFFFGSSQKVLDSITRRMNTEFPTIDLCGTISPPFRAWSSEENSEMIKVINAARPDVLWVGMTAPKQEKWVYENRHVLNAPVIGSIGAVFDFFAGTYPRAPKWMCRWGIEWAYRLVSEPRRMWRRNFISTPVFVFRAVAVHLLGLGRQSRE